MSRPVRAVFLDRDGVINRRIPGGYVRSWEQFRFLRGARAGMRLLGAAGYRLAVFTNQRGISLGVMTESDLEAVHRRMRAALERDGIALDAVLHCPHGDDEGCDCRKPRPGMLVRAVRGLDADPARSWVVGDSLSDIAAGAALGIPGILVAPRGTPPPPGARTAASLLAAARLILREDADAGA